MRIKLAGPEVIFFTTLYHQETRSPGLVEYLCSHAHGGYVIGNLVIKFFVMIQL